MTFKTRVRRLLKKKAPIPVTVARVYRDGKHVEDLIAGPGAERIRRPAKKARG